MGPSVVQVLTVLSLTFFAGALTGEEGQSGSVLIDSLSTADPEVQSGSSRKLGELKEERAIPRLIELLDSSPNAEVRRSAAVALAQIGRPGPSTEALLRAVQKDGSATVRYTALVGLSRLYDSDRRDVIVKECSSLENSEDPFLKDIAVRVRLLYEK
jgi:HEAT repeat protein